MSLPPRMNLLTLACDDVPRMRAFFQTLGWPEAPSSDEHYAVFQLTNGVVLALWGADHYRETRGGRADGFRGFTLGVNVGSWEELDAAHDACSAAEGILDLEPIQKAFWGGGFMFRDPEGNLWEIAWAEGTRVGPDGGLTWF